MFGAIQPSDAYAEAQRAIAVPVAQPALYLHGMDDEFIGIELAADAERAFPNGVSRVVRVQDAGHVLNFERPHFVNEQIGAFLRETATST